VDFIHGIATVGGIGAPANKSGLAIYLYACNASMGDTAFYNSDGEFLVVPQLGKLRIRSEMGRLDVEPNEILVIPRGVKFSVDLQDGETGARGYILEVFENHFVLPELGPIGANCLANPRDFLSPTAWYEDRDVECTLLNKFGGKLFSAAMHHSPFDVVAWHGNMSPYKYDLRKFICINSVTKDHPDPSIYTVLTCPSSTPGVAVADFVIFPPRWMVMEDSFRPPWYHRNTMTEYMGMGWGQYDAKAGGFVAGGSSLHSCMSAHGPDATTFEKASEAKLKPEYFDKGLAFMFETKYQLKLSKFSTNGAHRDRDYSKCWSNLPKKFNPAKK
jgi:homogentisate 1,2-dioxygenase